MRILSFILSIILLLSFSACDKSSPDSANVNSELTLEEVQSIVAFDSFEMTLVNSENPIEEGFSPALSRIDEEFCPEELYFATVGIDDLHRLFKAAKDNEMNITISSAWRSADAQASLFNNQLNQTIAANPSMEPAQAQNTAATIVHRPGTSEHQLGLAVDFCSANDDFMNTREYHWLVSNCSYFGFILRYNEASTDKTGVLPKSWHFRYVGVENAKMIEKSGLCLEEFIEKYASHR